MNFLRRLFGGGRPTNADLGQEFTNLFETCVFETTADRMRAKRLIDNAEIARIATDKAANALMRKYNIPVKEMAEIVAHAVRRM